MWVLVFSIVASYVAQGSMIPYKADIRLTFNTYQQCSTYRLERIKKTNVYIKPCVLLENKNHE